MEPQSGIAPAPSADRAKVVLTAVLISAISAVRAYYGAFSGHARYDDEGTLLFWLKRFFDGVPLYDGIHMQYGPLFYAYETLAHTLTGATLSNDSLRFVSIFFWVAAGALVFLVVYKFTGNLPVAAGAQVLAFRTMEFIGREPGHPQELCITLALAFALAACYGGRKRALQMGVMGALAGALFALKINAGLFAAMALACLFVFTWRPGGIRSFVTPVIAVGVLLFPVLLVRNRIAEVWVWELGAVVVLSLGSIMAAAIRAKPDVALGPRHVAAAVGGMALAVCASVGFALAHGTTIRGMYQWLIVFPATTFVNGWFIAARMHGWGVILGLVGFALAWYAGKRRSVRLLARLKLLFAAIMGVLCMAARYDDSYLSNYFLNMVPALLWLVTLPAEPGEPGRTGSGRLALAFLAAAFLLYVYPVAGSQVPFSAVLPLVAAAVCLGDSVRFFQGRLGARTRFWAGRIGTAAALLLLLAFSKSAWSAYRRYQAYTPVNFRGAERLHLPPGQAAEYRELVERAAGCGALITIPPLASFHFWAGKPAPPALGVGDGVDAASRLAARDTCIIYNPRWTRTPWLRAEEFETVFETGDYQLMRRKESGRQTGAGNQ